MYSLHVDLADVITHGWLPVANDFKLEVNSTSHGLLFTEETYEAKDHSISLPVTLRHGDLNGDGYPDIVSVMSIVGRPEQKRVILLENIAGDGFLGRTFRPFEKQPNFYKPLVAAMFGKHTSDTTSTHAT